MKCTCPTQRPNARHPTPPIFHWEWGSRWLPNAKKSTHKIRNVHGRRKKLASPNARDTNMLVFLALGDAKLLSFASGDAKVPDARYFAFWWNIGLTFSNIYQNITIKWRVASIQLPAKYPQLPAVRIGWTGTLIRGIRGIYSIYSVFTLKYVVGIYSVYT